jgi:hypothetical protein
MREAARIVVTIDRVGAEVLARLSLDDLRGYAVRYPTAHAAYLAVKQKAASQSHTTGKRRRIKKM